MKEETATALKRFSATTNWGTLGHPNDMERFWDFVITAFHQNDYEISSEDFCAIVSANTTDEESQRKMYTKYEDGIELLRRFVTSSSVE